jgi:GDPmannose 4,6-dehydratase
MRLTLSHEVPDNFVIASGVATSVRDFIKFAFSAVEIDVVFEGSGLSEIGINRETGEQLVSVDSDFYRASETITLVGDPQKARSFLGWRAQTSISDVVRIMVEEDLASMRSNLSES